MKMICRPTRIGNTTEACWMAIDLAPETAQRLLTFATLTRSFLNLLVQEGMVRDARGCIALASPIEPHLFKPAGDDLAWGLDSINTHQWTCMNDLVNWEGATFMITQDHYVKVYRDYMIFTVLRRQDDKLIASPGLRLALLKEIAISEPAAVA